MPFRAAMPEHGEETDQRAAVAGHRVRPQAVTAAAPGENDHHSQVTVS
jgi:hypothetical protein